MYNQRQALRSLHFRPVVAVLLAITVYSSAQLSFEGQQITNTASDPTSVHAADVDGDGDTDIILASFGDDTVAVFLNGGETAGTPITWTEQKITTTADGPFSVYAADVDSDGDMDVVAASYIDSTVAVFLNGGDAHHVDEAGDQHHR